jgi:hypothetical protein
MIVALFEKNVGISGSNSSSFTVSLACPFATERFLKFAENNQYKCTYNHEPN